MTRRRIQTNLPVNGIAKLEREYSNLSNYKQCVSEAQRRSAFPYWVHIAYLAETAHVRWNVTYDNFRKDVGEGRMPKNITRWIKSAAIWNKVRADLRIKCRKVSYYDAVRKHPRFLNRQWSESKCLEHIISTGGGRRKVFAYFSLLSSIAALMQQLNFTPENDVESAALKRATRNASLIRAALNEFCKNAGIAVPRATSTPTRRRRGLRKAS